MTTNKNWWDDLIKQEAHKAERTRQRVQRVQSSHANPYFSAYAWWWDDEMDTAHGPFETQRAATFALFQHMSPRKSWLTRFIDWIAPLDDEGKYG